MVKQRNEDDVRETKITLIEKERRRERDRERETERESKGGRESRKVRERN